MTPAFLLAVLSAQAPRVVLLPIEAVDEVPPRVVEKLDQLLRAEIESVPLSAKASAVPDAEVQARASYQQGVEAYRSMSFPRSIELFGAAIDLLEGELDRVTDVDLLVSAHVELAVAQIAAKRAEAAEKALLRAIALRPDLELTIDRYPPRVIDAFAKARKTAAKQKKAKLGVSSSPGFARLEIDGVGRGDTPASVELFPGKHRWIVEKEDHLPARGIVEVRAGATETLEVALSADPVRRARLAIVEAVRRSAPAEDAMAPVTELAAALEVEEVLIAGVAAEGGGYVLSLAKVVRGERRALVWARTDSDLSNAPEAIRALAEHLRSSSGNAGPPSQRIDPAGSLVGLGPAPATKVAATTEVAEPESSTALWWWLGIGAVVVAAAAGTTAYFLTRPNGPEDPNNIIVVLRDPGAN